MRQRPGAQQDAVGAARPRSASADSRQGAPADGGAPPPGDDGAVGAQTLDELQRLSREELLRLVEASPLKLEGGV
eukprot:13770515-Alexandrium_andersonii.AAC.1